MRTLEERRAYQRGYAAGAKWPLYKPPMPPHEVLGPIMEAAKSLRDGMDSQLAMFDENDEINSVLGPLIGKFDEAMVRFGEWLKSEDLA